MPRSSPTRPLTNGKRTGKPHAKKRSHSEDQLQTISADGDLVLVCSPSKDQENSKQTSYSVRVSSAALRRPGSYFAILLDLEKFQEGRTLQETKLVLEAKYGSWDEAVRLAGVDELAHINVEIPPVATKLDRTALVETFFRIVTASDGRNASVSSGDSLHKLADMPIPFLASLAVLSDRFGVVPVLKDALRQAHTPKKEAPGDGLARLLRRLRTYDSGNEGRLRQAIYVSLILDDKEAVRSTTHILITRGSREWRFDTLDQCTAGIERAIWWYLPMGIEEELAFRHQCILNTIANLQSHFLRAYGAIPPTGRLTPQRRLQCTRAYENSQACDSFHLGEMIRFFSYRTKTIVLESSIAAPDTYSDAEDDHDNRPNGHHPPPSTTTTTTTSEAAAAHNLTLPQSSTPSQSPPTNIAALISSLRQCPEYQIDNNHGGCGVRRRLIPALDCLEVFTNSHAHVLGICLWHWNEGVRSWRDKGLSKPVSVSISKGGIIEAAQWRRGRACCDCVAGAEDARAIFSTREHLWNL